MVLEVAGVLLLALGLAGGAALLKASRISGARLDQWREGVIRQGLTNVEIDDSVPGDLRLTARAPDGSAVIMFVDWSGTIVKVGGLGLAPGDLSLSHEGAGASWFDGREIKCGDGYFDALARIHGRPAVVHAVLTAEARAAMGALMRRAASPTNAASWPASDTSLREAELRGGELWVSIASRDVRRVVGELPSLLSAAERLRRPADLPARLRENARGDPIPAVRLANLETLIAERLRDPGTYRALRAALEDPAPEIRLRAAKVLGSDGVGVLEALATAADVLEVVRGQAVDALARSATTERIRSILDHSLERGRLAPARKLIVALGQRHSVDAVPRLGELLDHESNDLAVEAAIALGRIGSRDAEPFLLRALGSSEGVRRRAAASALGRVGTVEAIVPLRRVAATYPFDRRLAIAARRATSAIQTRAEGSGAGSGHLSVVTPSADGNVALVRGAPESATGQISLDTPEE